MNNKRKTLIFFTSGFPFEKSETYIETEIKYLEKKFDEIIIISNDITSIDSRPVPQNVKIYRLPYELSLKDKIFALRYLFSKTFYDEINIIKKVYNLSVSHIIIKTILVSIQTGTNVVKFIKRVITENNLQNNGVELFLYSYWNNNMAYGIARLKQQNPEIITFTRAHRWDIYFEENKSKYLPMRKFTENNLNTIFFISKHGRDYFSAKMGNNSDKLKVSYLGIESPDHQSLPDKHIPLRIVSCSSMIKRKRIDIIIKALEKINQFDIIWNHIGGGSELPSFHILTENLLGTKQNIQYKLMGTLDNKEIYEYYKNETADIFINLSQSEGIPVSIMEAMSFGILVIATNVGGVSEIVNNENGVLLSANPEIEEVKSAIDKFYNMDEKTFKTYRLNAYNTWKEHYNAEINYPAFIEEVMKL